MIINLKRKTLMLIPVGGAYQVLERTRDILSKNIRIEVANPRTGYRYTQIKEHWIPEIIITK